MDVTLTNWIIHNIGKYATLSGTANEHPRLGTNACIAYTTAIVEVEQLSETEFMCRTRNTNYICNWKYAHLHSIDRRLDYNVSDIPGCEVLNMYNAALMMYNGLEIENCNIPKSEVYKIIGLATLGAKELAIKEKQEDEELKALASKYDDSIYLKLSTISKGSKAAYNIGGELGVLRPYTDEVKNSVVYTGDVGIDKVAFEYNIGYNFLYINSMSNNIKGIIIENMKSYNIAVNNIVVRAKSSYTLYNSEYHTDRRN